jgi:protein-disulfide isomerase
MSKQFWAVVAVIVIVFVGIFALTGKKDSGTTGDAGAVSNHVIGSGSTGVTLVEYGDYQCPYCQVYSATVKQVVEEYKDQITFQFVHFPLPNLHQNAFAASRAAEAAGKQGKFWEMHDLLYQNADPNGASGWVVSTAPTTFFNGYAKQLGLNMTKFEADYASTAVNSTINADMSKGNDLGVEGTPSFFVDGKKTEIGNTVADFKKVLDAAIKGKQTSSGSTPQSTEPAKNESSN